MNIVLRFRLKNHLLLTSAGIAILHYGLATISTALSFENSVTPLWPSAGLFLAAILLLGYRILPSCRRVYPRVTQFDGLISSRISSTQ
jgi:two-component system, NtrC family, sensor kinase